MQYRIVKSSSGKPESNNKCEVLIKKSNSSEDLQASLASLPPELAPGSMAYTADLTSMFQKDLDGTWAKIGG